MSSISQPQKPRFIAISNLELETAISDSEMKELIGHYVYRNPGLSELGCNRWLIESDVKRYIWRLLYGAIPTNSLRVLDVGGGVSAMTCYLAEKYEYSLVDLLAHDSSTVVNTLVSKYPIKFYYSDWSAVPVFASDVVIALDIFPNVDQRLSDFLVWVRARADTIILLLTFYPSSRSYLTKRIDADEYLTFRAWDSYDLSNCIRNLYGATNCDSAIMTALASKSLFPNERRCIAMVCGDANIAGAE